MGGWKQCASIRSTHRDSTSRYGYAVRDTMVVSDRIHASICHADHLPTHPGSGSDWFYVQLRYTTGGLSCTACVRHPIQTRHIGSSVRRDAARHTFDTNLQVHYEYSSIRPISPDCFLWSMPYYIIKSIHSDIFPPPKPQKGLIG